MARPEIPGESRWACLSLLVDAALLLASALEESPEAAANRFLAGKIFYSSSTPLCSSVFKEDEWVLIGAAQTMTGGAVP